MYGAAVANTVASPSQYPRVLCLTDAGNNSTDITYIHIVADAMKALHIMLRTVDTILRSVTHKEL